MRILLVDDEVTYLLPIATALEALGHEVIIANDGAQGYEIVLEQKVQMVISDWNMPVLDGVTFCRQLREAQLPYYVYFILLTARGDRDSLLIGLESGADDFLVKPVDNRELQVRLKAGERILALEQALEEKNQALEEANESLLRDMNMAAAMQLSNLPKPCQLEQAAFDWLFLPSRLVGGDMLGFFPISPQRWGFFMIDVSGHGVASALISFSVSKMLWQEHNDAQALRASAATHPYGPEELIARLNRRFLAEPESEDYFLTMVFGTFSPDGGEVTLSAAGHPPPLYWNRHSGTLQESRVRGMPVGIREGSPYETETFQLQPGDRLFVYSDGIVECPTPSGELFGEARFRQFLAGAGDMTLPEIRETLRARLLAWCQTSDMPDDVSLLMLERR